MKIQLPFRIGFKEPMLKSEKIMTVRSRRYGKPGDTFEQFGAEFRIILVMRMRLGYVAEDCHIQEGCKDRDMLIGIYKDIHPAKGFDPDEIVWAHVFVRMQ